MTDDEVRALFGPLTASTETAAGHEEARDGGPLAAPVLRFFPVTCGRARIDAVPGSLRVFVSPRARGSTPHVSAVRVHDDVSTPPVEVYSCALPETDAGVIRPAKGKPLGAPAEVAKGYERELTGLRKKVQKRLARIAAALAEGETGFDAHDAWPEA